MKYKKGQWLERTNNDSPYFIKGKYYKISSIHKDGKVVLMDDDDVFLYSKADIPKHFKPAPKTWQTLEVGDVVIDEDGDEMIVLEVLDRSFLLSDYDDMDEANYWLTFKKAEKIGWKIKGAEEADIEELTMEEVCKELGRTIKIKK